MAFSRLLALEQTNGSIIKKKKTSFNLEVMFRDFDFATHGTGLACVHAVGMGIVGHQEHLIIPALPVKSAHTHTQQTSCARN